MCILPRDNQAGLGLVGTLLVCFKESVSMRKDQTFTLMHYLSREKLQLQNSSSTSIKGHSDRSQK